MPSDQLDALHSPDCGNPCYLGSCSRQTEEIHALANVAIASIAVELLTAGGETLKGFELSDPFSGDDVRHVVTFDGRTDVSPLAGKPVVLRFQLRDAELYSFAFRNIR